MAQASRDQNNVPTLLGVSNVDGVTPIKVYADPVTHRLLVDAAGAGFGTVTSISQSTGILLTPNPITTTGTVGLATNIAPIATLGTAGQSIRVNAGATALEYYTPSASGLVVGTTTITGGTTTRILYDNAGVLGEYTLTGTGTVVVMATSPVLTTPTIGVAAVTSLTYSGAVDTNLITFPDNINGNALTFRDASGGILMRFKTANGFEETTVYTNAQFAGTILSLGAVTVGSAGGNTGSIILTGTTSGAVTVKVADAAGTWTMTLPTDDGTSGQVLSTDGAGVTSWVNNGSGGVPTTITVADEATDTTCFLGFFTAATGDLGPKTNANLTFNSNTGVATFGQTIAGSITGNAGTVTVADAGGDTTTFPLLATDATGSLSPRTDAGLTYNATTNALTATTFVGALTGNADTITVADEATDTSCFIGFYTAATGSLGGKTNANMTFNSNTGVVTFASSVLTTTDINGGTVDGTVIGGASAAAITGTVITANTSVLPDADGGAALGSATLGFSILGLASASTINWANGNAVLTHSSGILTVSTGDLRVTTAGTNTASVVTVGGTQTLTNKTLTSPAITTATFSGAQQLAEGAGMRLDAALSADGTWSGTTIAGTAGATLAFGDLVYLAVADSRWELADADASSTAGGVLMGFVVLAAAADGDPTVILLDGNIRADAAFPALTVGAPVYAGTTAGDIQVAQPSGTDDVIQVVGFALTADSIIVKISPDYITHT